MNHNKNWSINQPLCDQMVYSLLVLHLRNENHLGVAAAHLLQRLEVADLHGCLAIQFLSCLPHQLSRLHISTRRDDLAFGETAFLGSTREGILKVLAELDILNEDLLNLD
jgi:hypothetical protein